jgi:hypothetical protein
MANETQRVKATMGGLKKRDIALLLAFAINVYNAMKAAAASFPSPLPTLPAFLAAITELQTIQGAMKGTAKPGSTAREAKRIPVVAGLDSLMAYVQALADVLTPHDAAALIVLAGFKVHGTPVVHKEAVTVRQATPGAPVTLEAYASLLTQAMGSHAVQYHWRYMVPGGTAYVTWTSPTSKSTVPATPPIPPLTTVVMEASATDSRTQSAWMLSQPFLVR